MALISSFQNTVLSGVLRNSARTLATVCDIWSELEVLKQRGNVQDGAGTHCRMDTPQVTRQWAEVQHKPGEDLGEDRIGVNGQQGLFETGKESQ